MKSIKKVRTEPQPIETIINSFERFALTDINHNKSRPVAAFILSICFIEQLSHFRYKFDMDDAKKPECFFEEYMPEYKGKNLYHKARHTLVHNYSSRYQFDIDNIEYENVPYAEINKVIYINTNVFIGYLEKAFKLIAKDFRDIIHEAYDNALINSLYFPVLVDTRR